MSGSLFSGNIPICRVKSGKIKTRNLFELKFNYQCNLFRHPTKALSGPGYSNNFLTNLSVTTIQKRPLCHPTSHNKLNMFSAPRQEPLLQYFERLFASMS